MQRALDRFPRQGDREPWINPQNYKRDKQVFRYATLEDGALIFSNPTKHAAKAKLLNAAE
jgi:hypothetical protein